MCVHVVLADAGCLKTCMDATTRQLPLLHTSLSGDAVCGMQMSLIDPLLVCVDQLGMNPLLHYIILFTL